MTQQQKQQTHDGRCNLQLDDDGLQFRVRFDALQRLFAPKDDPKMIGISEARRFEPGPGARGIVRRAY
jgi:hypothetical protein